MGRKIGHFNEISIHALREEGDGFSISTPQKVQNFYPRPPRGGRRSQRISEALKSLFLSTPSARRATYGKENFSALREISIHALREEGDLFSALWS